MSLVSENISAASDTNFMIDIYDNALPGFSARDANERWGGDNGRVVSGDVLAWLGWGGPS